MFIYNFKINGSKIYKYFLFIIIGLLLIISCIIFINLFKGAKEENNSSCIKNDSVSSISPKNYTNVLKSVHENIENYIDLKIRFSGYVYRVSDLNENQFILARDMIISSDLKTLVVGFLCEYNNIKEYDNNTWIEITGIIKKGQYHGDMPIIMVQEIKRIDKPKEEYVYPPDENYIPTNNQI